MPDTRPRVPLNGKAIRLGQLAAEVGADLTASDTEVVVADDDSTVTQSALQSAVDAHVPAVEPDPEAEFTSAVTAIDTSKIGDAATKAALDAIKAVLAGAKGPGAEPRRGA